MISAYLVRLVEQHADKLTEELVADLQGNPHTASYHRLSPDELRHRAHLIYHGLGDWLASTDDEVLRSRFQSLGRQRFHDHVPLSQLLYALVLTKKHLRDKIRSVGNVSSALELHNELHLSMMIERFFDKILHAVAQGYEIAHELTEHPSRPAVGQKTPLETTRAKIDWVP
jgi:hypothetical protein